MLKINSYCLYLLIALFSTNPNELCSSFTQPNSAQNLPNVPIHNVNFDSLLTDLFYTNLCNTQQGVTLPETTGNVVLNGPNLINVNNSTNLLVLPYGWYLNAAANTYVTNNVTLPSTLPHIAATLPNISSILPPMQQSGIANNIIVTSFNTSNNPIPSVSSHTQQQEVVHTNQDKDHAQSEKKKKRIKTYMCPTCNKSLNSQNALKYHVKTHEPNRKKPYRCNLCDKSFTAKHTLKTHIKRHKKEKSFSCDFCHKPFTTKQEKIDHHRIHTGEKPYQCTLCGKCFSMQSTLRYHMRTHTGERQFKCDICQKGLSSKRALKDHLNKHSGKKPYKCTQCTRAYTSKEGLKYHLSRHNSPKPYTCNYCDAAFTYQSEYKNHINYETSEHEDRKCHLCKRVYVDKSTLKKHNKTFHPER